MGAELAIAAGIGAAQNIAAGIGAGVQNRRNRQFQWDMYNQQRKDALSDWNMNNQYNSPEEQMRRLKQAGLNPNMVYGQGAVANSAKVPDATSNRNYNYVPFQLDLSSIGQTINQYFNVQKAKQEIDNLKTQQEVMQTTAELNRWKAITEGMKPEYLKASTANKSEDTELKKSMWGINQEKMELMGQQYQFNSKINPLLINAKKAQIANTIANTTFQNSENSRRNEIQPWKVGTEIMSILQTKANTAKTYEQIKQINSQIKYTQTMDFQQSLENLSRVQGISFKDSQWSRNISKGLNYYGNSIDPGLDKLMETLDKDWNKKSKGEKMRVFLNLNK